MPNREYFSGSFTLALVKHNALLLLGFIFIALSTAINECKEYCTGINVNEMRLQMLRFADDIAIIAQDEINLKRAFESLDDILKSKYKMKIN